MLSTMILWNLLHQYAQRQWTGHPGKLSAYITPPRQVQSLTSLKIDLLKENLCFAMMGLDHYTVDWQQGILVSCDYWACEDAFIAKRLSGEVEYVRTRLNVTADATRRLQTTNYKTGWILGLPWEISISHPLIIWSLLLLRAVYEQLYNHPSPFAASETTIAASDDAVNTTRKRASSMSDETPAAAKRGRGRLRKDANAHVPAKPNLFYRTY
ncbi:hypothetical protein DFH08DRAFT_799077 [Mycena albidolilacea]|uniref:Uncharacterized protein n=1 Tax=Mycena albidolilacea TaxID=1033008 RepID=A0AAD7F3U5_9AGAR|nr:hypothetical protein DFH08DRAFT_799077 [Mycena albidolilacea]